VFKKEISWVASWGYDTRESTVGIKSPINHPQQSKWVRTDTDTLPTEVVGLRTGDLVRCDGLLFMSRPRTIYGKWEAVVDKNGFLKSWKRDVLYSPVKVGDGFWVLRKSV
jgi:hypothetical protein